MILPERASTGLPLRFARFSVGVIRTVFNWTLRLKCWGGHSSSRKRSPTLYVPPAKPQRDTSDLTFVSKQTYLTLNGRALTKATKYHFLHLRYVAEILICDLLILTHNALPLTQLRSVTTQSSQKKKKKPIHKF